MRNKRMIIGQKSFAFGCDGDLIEIDSSSHQESENSSTNGNADNRDIELDDKYIFGDESTMNINLVTTYPDNTETKSTMSKIRMEKRFSKQLSIDDSAQDLNSLKNNSPTDELYSRSREDYNEPTAARIYQRFIDDQNREHWKIRREESDDDCTLSNSPRRSSYDSCDMKKMPWKKLSRDEGRRYSDGSLRQTASSTSRRKSLKRQSRISDVEAVQYCDSYYCSNLVVPEDNEISGHVRNDEDTGVISENMKLESNETDRRINRSDRLSKMNMEETLDSSMEKISEINIDVTTEINGGTSKNAVENADTGEKKNREKKRHGLSAILGIYGSVMSVKMEPGF